MTHAAPGGRSPALDAVFKPVQPPTTFEETVERLGTAIRLGLLSPGMRLPAERELADQLSISRSTLRQALTTLVQSGHLVALRGRSGGTFVAEEPPLAKETDAPPLSDEARAVLDYRVVVETGATVLAAERADDDDLDLLYALTEHIVTLGKKGIEVIGANKSVKIDFPRTGGGSKASAKKAARHNMK